MVVRTDLAMELHAEAVKETGDETGFSAVEEWIDGFQLQMLKIDHHGEQRTGKKEGIYWTLHLPQLRLQHEEWQGKMAAALEKVIRRFLSGLNLPPDAPVLLVGLGNGRVTPDSFGPLVVANIFVTSHLFTYEPSAVENGYRKVTAVAPGVMGTTGMETGDMIKGIVNETGPSALIVFDALASRAIERLHATVQLSSTGIRPGSGVGNKRKEISAETMGVPVISIGIPTVVDAVTITSDALSLAAKVMDEKRKEKPSALLTSNAVARSAQEMKKRIIPKKEEEVYLGVIGKLSDEEKRQYFEEVLTSFGQNLIVTPKDTDLFSEQSANVVAMAVNSALHEALKDGGGMGVTH